MIMKFEPSESRYTLLSFYILLIKSKLLFMIRKSKTPYTKATFTIVCFEMSTLQSMNMIRVPIQHAHMNKAVS